MHDAISAERIGTPSAAVMTTAFINGAEPMASALGVTGYRFAVITHPIASATHTQLEDKARHTIEQSVRLLLS